MRRRHGILVLRRGNYLINVCAERAGHTRRLPEWRLKGTELCFMAPLTIAGCIACIEKNHVDGDVIGYNDYAVQDVNQLELSMQSRMVPAFSSGLEL